MKEDLISIVVPIHNVEKYLVDCIESIIHQEYENLEIILVDDESPDNCPKICDEYANKDKRIKVIHKKNGGLSDARNAGIDIAKGKYISFIDSDDTVDKEYISSMYGIIKKYSVNIAIAPHKIICKNKIINTGKRYEDVKISTEETLRRMLLDEGITVSAWSKLYLTSLFKDIRYPKGKIYEDIGTTYKLIIECDYVGYTSEAHYNYFKREGTITTSEFKERKLTYISFSDIMGDDILKKYPSLKNEVKSKKVEARFSVLRQMYLSGNSDKFKDKEKEIINYLKDNKGNILKSKGMKRRNKIALILLLMGKNIFKFAWKIYSFIKY